MASSDQLTTPLVSSVRPREGESLVNPAANTETSSAIQPSPPVSIWSSFLNGIYDSASNLANLLPTGTFLAFTAIAPIITDNGTCDIPSELWRSAATTIFFAVFCYFSCFTDSFQAPDGQVYYGLVTFWGLWTPQLPVALRTAEKEKYKLKFIDVLHALLSVAVFAACSLVTPNIRSCLFPTLSDVLVQTVPGIVSFVVSTIFTLTPSTRHGIGFPLSPATLTSVIQEATGTGSSSSTAPAKRWPADW